jgi:hypothetical protein
MKFHSLICCLLSVAVIIVGQDFCHGQQQPLKEVQAAMAATEIKNRGTSTSVLSPEMVRAANEQSQAVLPKIEIESQSNISTNSDMSALQSQNPATGQTPKRHEPDPNNPEEVKAWLAENAKNKQASSSHATDDWKTPIEFYGRVVDEANNAVSDATVNYSCNDTSLTGTSYYHMQSDANGLFAFKGIQGKLLEVDVSKEGYYSYDAHGQFFYYAGENHNFAPDQANPVIFRLRKKGEGANLIKSDFPAFAHIAQLKHDGTSVGLDLFEGQQVAGDAGQLKLEFWRDLAEKNPKIFNWKLQLTIPGGGFVATTEQFPFIAPDNGYTSVLVFDMQTNNPNWQGNVKANYYLQLPNGKYGRMSFEFLPWNGVFTIHSLINPSGSRNLEPLQ